MNNNRIPIVWVCSFSNPDVRRHYSLRVPLLLKWLQKATGNFVDFEKDNAIWNTNAIKEFEKYNEFELHIVSPVRYLSKRTVEFEINGVHYHFFREQHSGLIPYIYFQLFDKYSCRFRKNRKIILREIEKIQPKIVHVVGAENPFYSLAALDVPTNIVLIVQLQALLMRLVSITNNPKQKKDFAYKGEIEKAIFERADYIGTTAQLFKDYIQCHFPTNHILDIALAMGPTINYEQTTKEFDFVYFSANIDKAGLEAVKSFALAQKKRPNIKLDIIGRYNVDYKQTLDEIIIANGIQNNVVFEGLLPTHDDVIKQIRKSKYALLPLKMDMVPNTVIEAMSNGLVVVTTITQDGTPKLNSSRECVLLSEQNDFQAMADNMILLVDKPEYAERLKNNSYQSIHEHLSNYEIMKEWRDAYLTLVG